MSEEKANKAIREEAEAELREVSDLLQGVLESKGFALQPFVQYTEYGMAARVRLVKTPKENTTNDKATDTGEAGESQDKDTDTTDKPA